MEYSEQERYWIWLNSIEGIGVRRFYSLIGEFVEALSVFLDKGRSVTRLEGFGDGLSARIAEHASEEYIDSIIEKAEKCGCRILTRLSPGYPSLLAEITDAPPVLYVKGGNIDMERCISMVGTRHSTRNGMDTARHLGRELSENGVTVISGMARGIDSASHEGALEGPSGTIAVLGCGVDVVYPPENKKLYERIAENGAVISDYPPGTPPNAGNFPARNRIISGMSRATVVVESPQKSGTMITVNYAQEQGRDVFAVPGSILSKSCEGTNRLLKEGAIVLCDVYDILEEYGWGVRSYDNSNNKTVKLDNEFQALYDILKRGEYSYEELEKLTGMETSKLNSALSILELNGLVRRLPGNIYFASF